MIWMFVAWFVLCASVPMVQAQGAVPPAITEEERALEEAKRGTGPFPLGASVSLTQSLGGGTFVKDEYVRRASYDVSLGVSPYWRITPMLRLGAGLSVSQSMVENYDSSVTKRNRTSLSDLSLSLTHLRIFTIPVVKIGINAGINASFPTSLQSKYRGLYLSTRARVGMSKIVGPVYLAYGVSFFKNFNRYTSPIIDKSRVGEHVVLSHYNGNEQLTTDLVSVGGLNTSHGLVNTFLVSWNIIDNLSLAVYYALNHSWTYGEFEKDDLSSPYADAGRGLRDSQTGVVDISYSINNNLSVSLGAQTMVAPKTANNEGAVFPFLNFSNNYRNNSAVYLGLGGNF